MWLNTIFQAILGSLKDAYARLVVGASLFFCGFVATAIVFRGGGDALFIMGSSAYTAFVAGIFIARMIKTKIPQTITDEYYQSLVREATKAMAMILAGFSLFFCLFGLMPILNRYPSPDFFTFVFNFAVFNTNELSTSAKLALVVCPVWQTLIIAHLFVVRFRIRRGYFGLNPVEASDLAAFITDRYRNGRGSPPPERVLHPYASRSKTATSPSAAEEVA